MTKSEQAAAKLLEAMHEFDLEYKCPDVPCCDCPFNDTVCLAHDVKAALKNLTDRASTE